MGQEAVWSGTRGCLEWDKNIVSRNNCAQEELAGENARKCNGISGRFHAGKLIQLIYGKYRAILSD